MKEKPGRLRYYVWHVPEKHTLAVAEAKQQAEERSFETCEVCGKPGKLVRSDGYWHTGSSEQVEPERPFDKTLASQSLPLPSANAMRE